MYSFIMALFVGTTVMQATGSYLGAILSFALVWIFVWSLFGRQNARKSRGRRESDRPKE